MSEIRYYRAEPPSRGRPPRRRRRRRSIWPLVALVAVFAVVLVAVLAAVPWFGHLGLPWPGGGTASGTGVNNAAVSGVHIATDKTRHDGKLLVRFTSDGGQPTIAQWRVDGGPWHKGKIAFVEAPGDGSNDGAHVMEVRAVTGGDVIKYTVTVDTGGPRVAGVSVTPARISGPEQLTLAYDVPAGDGVTVTWSVVDALGRTVGAQGTQHAAAGPETVAWAAKTESGGALFPGTYRFTVTAADPAGNEVSAAAYIACDAPREAQLINDAPKAGKLVALTFDGGSGYAWRHIMRALAKLDAGGTFFCTGVSVDKYPEVAREALALGMEIGNHSFDHPDFSTIPYEEARRQLLANADAWWKACRAIPAPFFRPPYGSYNSSTLAASGSAGFTRMILWDVDARDWTEPGSGVIAQRVLAAVHPGSIVCLHLRPQTAAALPAILSGLRARGYKAVSLPELFRAAGYR